MIKQYITPFIRTQKQKKVINKSDLDDVFESFYATFKPSLQKALGKVSGWIIDLVISRNINISK